jgi:hypothetical protein
MRDLKVAAGDVVLGGSLSAGSVMDKASVSVPPPACEDISGVSSPVASPGATLPKYSSQVWLEKDSFWWVSSSTLRFPRLWAVLLGSFESVPAGGQLRDFSCVTKSCRVA